MGSTASASVASTEQWLQMIAAYLRERNLSLADAFTFLDIDESGTITWEEFHRGVCVCLDGVQGHQTMTLDTLHQIFLRFDHNRDGSLSIQEFAAAFNPPDPHPQDSFAARGGGFWGQDSGIGAPTQGAQQKTLAEEVLMRIASSISRTGHTPQDLFVALDKDRSGALSRLELENVVVSFQPDLSLTERDAVFKIFDANMSGSIDFNEFCNALQNVNGSAMVAVENKLKELAQKFKRTGYDVFEAFSVFDRNNDGFLARDEWQRAMNILGAQLDAKDLESTFRYFDGNNDGFVSLAEFRKYFQSALDRAAPLETGVMPVYTPPPVEEPWEVETFNLVRECLSVGRSGFGITEVFRRLDVSGTNTLTPQEFYRVIQTYRPELTQAHLDQLFWKINTSRSGEISMSEFIRRFG